MVRFLLRFGLAVATLIALPSLSSAASQLQKAEFSSPSADSVQLVLGLTAAATPKVFTLDSPDRVVIDLPATRLASGAKMPAAAGPVKSVRSAMQDRRTLRIVLELNKALDPSRAEPRQSNWSSALARRPRRCRRHPPRRCPCAQRMRLRMTGETSSSPSMQGTAARIPAPAAPHGTREKDVVLAIARALARRIDAEPGMKAVLTRDADRFIPLRERIGIARKARADIFVSIHADAIRNRDVSGSSVYVLADRGASSEAARWLAEQENAADLKGGVSLGDKSDELAVGADGCLAERQHRLEHGGGRAGAHAAGPGRDHPQDRGAARRVRGAEVAGHPLDAGGDGLHLQSRRGAASCASGLHQQAIAEAIFNGVREHFRTSPPDGSLFARQRDSRRGAAPIMAGSATR